MLHNLNAVQARQARDSELRQDSSTVTASGSTPMLPIGREVPSRGAAQAPPGRAAPRRRLAVGCARQPFHMDHGTVHGSRQPPQPLWRLLLLTVRWPPAPIPPWPAPAASRSFRRFRALVDSIMLSTQPIAPSPAAARLHAPAPADTGRSNAAGRAAAADGRAGPFRVRFRKERCGIPPAAATRSIRVVCRFRSRRRRAPRPTGPCARDSDLPPR